MASDDWLIADELALNRGGRPLFAGLGLRLGRGDALVITGPNGAGKSSLLRVIAGLLAPTAGTISNPFRTAFLPGETALKADGIVRDELNWWAQLDGAPASAVSAGCEAMAVTALLDFRCGQLSSGQRQRIALARTIACGAELWLLDEPANALDKASEARLVTAIASHRAAGGVLIVATHQPINIPAAQGLSL